MEQTAGISAFWDRFLAQERLLRTQLAALSSSGDAEDVQVVLDDLSSVLNNEICLEAGAAEDGALELVISADGLSDRISLVTAVTGSAPALPGWRFVAFRPRIPTEHVKLSMEFGEIDPEEVGFIAFQTESPHEADMIDLLLVAPTLDGKVNSQQLSSLLFLLLDMMIGEYFVMTRLAGIDFTTEIPTDPDVAQALQPLTELPALVDSLGSDSLH